MKINHHLVRYMDIKYKKIIVYNNFYQYNLMIMNLNLDHNYKLINNKIKLT